MSAWAIFSMMVLYPDCPGLPEYTLTTPTFDEVTIKLDPEYWGKDKLVIKKEGHGDYIKEIRTYENDFAECGAAPRLTLYC